MKYRKKPVVIEAVQWQGTHTMDAVQELAQSCDRAVLLRGWQLIIPTLEGDMMANLGDWVIRGVAGELYPCKPDIFEATYEPVEP